MSGFVDEFLDGDAGPVLPQAPYPVCLVDYPDYELWSDGSVVRVRGRKQGPLTPHDGKARCGGYMKVRIRREGGARVTWWVHRLICTAFHGPPPDPSQFHVSHLDGDPSNNAADNLGWKTPSENMYDKYRHYE